MSDSAPCSSRRENGDGGNLDEDKFQYAPLTGQTVINKAVYPRKFSIAELSE